MAKPGSDRLLPSTISHSQRILVAQLGARRHYAVPRALHEAGVLECLVTDACADVMPWRLLSALPRGLLRGALAHLAGRRTGLPRGKVEGVLPLIVSDYVGSTRRRPGESNIQHWVRRNRRFGDLVVKRGFGDADAVYVFNGAGVEILREARRIRLRQGYGGQVAHGAESCRAAELQGGRVEEAQRGEGREQKGAKSAEVPEGGKDRCSTLGEPRTKNQERGTRANSATQQPNNPTTATPAARGLFCVVDQTSAAMRWDAKLLMEEAERWPDWVTPEDSMDGWEAMAAREEEEWRLADRIICGSQYVVDTIKAVGGPVEKCRVVPYGYGGGVHGAWGMAHGEEGGRAAELQGGREAEREERSGQRTEGRGPKSEVRGQSTEGEKAECLTLDERRTKNQERGIRDNPATQQPNNLAIGRSSTQRPLRVLFAGTLCLRKGIPYLYEAIKMLDRERFEFRIVGPSAISEQSLARLKAVADVRGAVPRAEMAEQYAWADVMVLPTLSEGSANVLHEARRVGLPVVTTSHAGRVDAEGETVIVVPVQDAFALAAAIGRLNDAQRHLSQQTNRLGGEPVRASATQN